MMFHEIAPKTLTENVFSLIGDRWMLITAGTPDRCNTMTASWGGLGVLWRKPWRPSMSAPSAIRLDLSSSLTNLPFPSSAPSGKRRCLIAVPSAAGTRISLLPAASTWPRLGRLRIFRRLTWSWFAKNAIGTIWTPLTWTPSPARIQSQRTITDVPG